MNRPRAHGLTQSVQTRLKDLARRENKPFTEVLLLYGLERCLYRLSKTPHGNRYVLKGALMMIVWDDLDSRPTNDIDLLGPVDLSAEDVEQLIRDSAKAEVPPDGIELDIESIRVTPIRIPEEHIGYRVRFDGFLARMRLRFQIDIGTGDSVVPEPVTINYPTLLDFPPPRLRAYTPYTTIAEKFQAIVKLELVNTRMKDYFDLVILSQKLALDGPTLVTALIRTFERRGMSLPETVPPGLTTDFVEAPGKSAQWAAFVRKGQLEDRALSLTDTIENIRVFLIPAVNAAAKKEPFLMHWPPGGSWQIRDEGKKS